MTTLLGAGDCEVTAGDQTKTAYFGDVYYNSEQLILSPT